MRPKGKLFALFAVFAAIGLVTASGAFTTVQAERTADVNVAGDANALLAIQPGDGGNSGYAQQSSGTVELSLDGDFNSQSAAGVNNNAITEVDSVLNITNQGTQDVDIYIERTGNDHPEAVTFYEGEAGGTNITSSDNSAAVTISPGTTKNISMTIDTTGTDVTKDDELLSDITIYANATSA